MKRLLRRAAPILLAAALTLSAAAPACATEEASLRTVRVGFYHAEGYHVMNAAGEPSGYGYEVLQAMKMYANWRYEYLGYDKGWADIQKMLLDGEIDIVVSAVKTPARMEIYDFTDRPVAQSGACLMVKAGESPYVAGNYKSYNGIRIGFIENAAQIASTEAFAKEKGFVFTPVYYKTSGELEEAIAEGKDIDAIVTSNMRIISNTRRLELFAMQDVYAMVRKGDTALLSEANYALDQLSIYSPRLFDDLYNKYYAVDTGDNVFFSPDESAFIADFIASGRVIRAALVPDMAPYAYYDNGVPSGILHDIATEIIRRTGLPCQVIPTESTRAYNELVRTDGVDLTLTGRFDYNYAEELGYTIANPYYNTDVSKVTYKGREGKEKVVAVVRQSAIETVYLPTILTDEAVMALDTVADCVDALLSGRCDAVYLLTRTAQEVVYTDQTNRLTSVIMPKFSIGYAISVRDALDRRLVSILEKSTASLSESDISAMVIKYTNYPFRPISLAGLLYNDPLVIVIAVAVLLGLVFASVMVAAGARQRKQDRKINAQLREALDSAERANMAKSVFMSRMSHEIRTPLNAVIGYNSISSNALENAKTEQELRSAATRTMDCLTKSDIASRHLLTVINDVLDMSAIESGKIAIAHEPFDFRSTLTSLSVMFFTQAKTKGVAFEMVFDTPTDEWFIGDQMRLSQVLTNLLSNAVKFTPTGGQIRLSVRQKPIGDDAVRMRFAVADTGIGMSQEFLDRIWTPFEQEDASISRRFGGTGLGLAITKNLTDLMGGTIEVQTEPDKGTTFIVELVLGRMAQPENDHTYNFADINVLVADDDKSTCDYLKLLFERSGVRCETVLSGEEAVTATQMALDEGKRFTLCILDWHMPGANGLETIARIREVAGPEVPIIVISAYDFSEIEQRARKAGADTFVSKPLFQSAVFDMLANVGVKRRVTLRHNAKDHDFGGARVLLAEDNAMNSEIARAILSNWNLSVDTAQNGRDAVAMFSASPAGTYSVILMDVHMPQMDGYAATRAIRASGHADAASIPIIAMTADVFAEDVARANEAGMNAHIGKPVDNVLLLETLIAHIGERQDN